MDDRKVKPINQTPNQANAELKPIKNRWAFLVGINDYVDLSFSKLNYCINDVKALEHILSRFKYTAICLHDKLDSVHPRFPNLFNIEEELFRLCDETIGEEDLLWVHFACHGTLLNNKEPVLIARDTRKKNLYKTALPLARVKELMRQSKAKRLVLTLDACHTGVEMGRGLTNNPDFIKNAYELSEGFALIAASTAQQVAQEWKAEEHGLFTFYLLEGLRGKAQQNKPFITVNDLQTYVVAELRSWIAKNGGQIQEPTYRAEGIGDIILGNLEEVESEIPLTKVEISFPTIKIIRQESKGNKIEVNGSDRNIEFFEKQLDDGITLKMTKIPGGKFRMGSHKTELEHIKTESPQHEVTIQSFFMSRYLVTQRQWQTVADKLPKVERDLNRDPSHFKGDNRPVEQVSWFEAVEFCDRLCQKTERQYRLPSEAEWEYACRANTQTPFHCGLTITTDLANYRCTDYKEEGIEYKGFYGLGNPGEGEYREQTTEVNKFKPNAFGLYDMHGNLYEWCADYWHDDYKKAPSDGRVWIEDGHNTHRVLRGGSWANNPGTCRSASRLGYYPEPRINIIGFRVVCEFI